MNSTIHTDPTVFVIFGGTGDLNMRKLAPALYNLFLDGFSRQGDLPGCMNELRNG